MKSEALAIGELAARTGVKVVTIRYYEKVGLMPAPPRTVGNYRAYGVAHLERLAFIRRCRELGFTLDEVRELLRLAERKEQSCADVDAVARSHLAEVERKIADLSRLASELRRVIEQCPGGRVADCRILETLADEAEHESC